MKKLLLLFFVLFMAGCGSKPSELPVMEWGEEDLSIIEKGTQTTISYGMTKSEIEGILGKEVAVSEASATKEDLIYSGGLFVGYRDGIAAELVIESDAYQTNKGITIGSTMQDVEDVCGYTEFSRGTVVVGSTAHLTQYIFDSDGNPMTTETMPERITSSDDFYVVSFEFESNRVARIRVCDALFSYKRS